MSAAPLSLADRDAIIQHLSRLPDFSTPRERAVMLELAGLGRFVPLIDLSGSSKAVTANLVLRLEKFGVLPEPPNVPALGALLGYALELGDLPADAGKVFAEVIARYGLLHDVSRMAELSARFGVLAPVSAPATPTSPVTAPESKPAPAFVPVPIDQSALETVIGSEDNFLDLHLLSGALYCAQAVCRIEFPEGTPVGTATLIGPNLLLTNQHVLRSQDYLGEAVARFDYKIIDETRGLFPGRVVKLKTDFFESSPSEALDYALFKTVEAPLAALQPAANQSHLGPRELLALGKHRGFIHVTPRFIRANQRVNIIQHPDGDPLKVVMTENYVVADMTEKRVQYIADTMPGSSGSPVFNQNWEFVALHHSGAPYPPDSVVASLKKAWKGKFRVNEGIPIRAILADFKSKGLESHLPPV